MTVIRAIQNSTSLSHKMLDVNADDSLWLSASFHMGLSYSCRMPMSSPHAGLALPTPGPATVRLALIRTSIELYGRDYVKRKIFPIIASMPVFLKPPLRVAISSQLTRAYKADPSNGLSETIAYRGFAQAHGSLTIYFLVPTKMYKVFSEIPREIGYWGQSNSLTFCTGIRPAEPESGSYAVPLHQLNIRQCLRNFFISFVSEIRDPQLGWSDVVSEAVIGRRSPLCLEPYVWPLIYNKRTSSGCLLLFHKLD